MQYRLGVANVTRKKSNLLLVEGAKVSRRAIGTRFNLITPVENTESMPHTLCGRSKIKSSHLLHPGEEQSTNKSMAEEATGTRDDHYSAFDRLV